MKHFDAIIIGAGASGLMCAATALRRGKSIAVIEHNPKALQKVSVSGGGKCNFTNMAASKDLIKKQAFYFKPGLHAMKNSSLKTLRAYAMVWKLLMG